MPKVPVSSLKPLEEKLHDNMTILNRDPREHKRAMTHLSAAVMVEAGTYD